MSGFTRQVKCPNNVYLLPNDYTELTKKLSKLDINTLNCGKNECNFLLNGILNGTIGCQELDKSIENMKSPQIRDFIKYNLYNLVNLKKKIAKPPKEQYGTGIWWKRNVWGANKMQNFIFIISFTISILYIMNTMYFIIKDTGFNTLYIILLVIFVVSYLVMAFYYGFKTYGKDIITTNNKPNFYNLQPSPEPEEDKNELGYIFGISITIIISIYLFILISSYLSDSSSIKNSLLASTSIILIGFLFIFNIYFAALLPMLYIIFIILQRLFISILDSNKRWCNYLNWAIIIIIFLFSFLPFFTNIKKDDNNKLSTSTTVSFFGLNTVIATSLLLMTYLYKNYPDFKNNVSCKNLLLYSFYYLFSKIKI